ncbi:11168_t:CDS:2 [Racocetra fulgida]|uniref:11168_t:CDS:1 n=1 Tax=Racocetra fulgida TaxID=60492 RepID=A0A9N8ZG15_9GLOM|nr:11168_t:CDS:2 [Racocetra fulgida]
MFSEITFYQKNGNKEIKKLSCNKQQNEPQRMSGRSIDLLLRLRFVRDEALFDDEW